MAELLLIRKLKEDGSGNQEILDTLAGNRVSGGTAVPVSTRNVSENNGDENNGNDPILSETDDNDREASDSNGESTAPARPRHALTCQTCGKAFEHTNPRLRDCLDCYRSKRKERRRGSTPRVVIQHPLAQQAASKSREAATIEPSTDAQLEALSENGNNGSSVTSINHSGKAVRNYRKAIDETRHITGNLKRRLDRTDLPEGERKWLEQIYAYQLILHQGWRHLTEYRSASLHQSQPQAQTAESSSEIVISASAGES
jgi:hypothetical protein